MANECCGQASNGVWKAINSSAAQNIVLRRIAALLKPMYYLQRFREMISEVSAACPKAVLLGYL